MHYVSTLPHTEKKEKHTKELSSDPSSKKDCVKYLISRSLVGSTGKLEKYGVTEEVQIRLEAGNAEPGAKFGRHRIINQRRHELQE